MKRDYNTGESDEVVFFIGNEVEHTPAYGMKTLFVTGLQSINSIEEQLSKVKRKDINHIFFGANHSYNPSPEEHQSWEDMIQFFLDKDYLCSLDIPMNQVEDFNDSGLNENDNFIPQIRVPIPYIRLWNYNTMLKIDDRDFKSTNPGVWSHSLHTLMDRKNFTDWGQYKKDEIIK
jgi:hypothetical protein